MLPQKSDADHLETRTVWYSGTDKLSSGYCVALDLTASKTDPDPKLRYGNVVAKPVTANLFSFAGVVAPQSDGLTGPCNIDILIPRKGCVLPTFTKLNMTAQTTPMGLVNNLYSLGAYADATVNFGLVGMAAETVDTSVTAANANVIYK
jgi:hypothetical protein